MVQSVQVPVNLQDWYRYRRRSVNGKINQNPFGWNAALDAAKSALLTCFNDLVGKAISVARQWWESLAELFPWERHSLFCAYNNSLFHRVPSLDIKVIKQLWRQQALKTGSENCTRERRTHASEMTDFAETESNKMWADWVVFWW